MGLLLPIAKQFAVLASEIKIKVQAPGENEERFQPFIFNEEQSRLALDLLGNPSKGTKPLHRVIVLKSRQVGISTFFLLLDIVVALINPGIKVALVVDTNEKAIELLDRCKQLVEAMGLGLQVNNQKKLQLKSGSEIIALTSGADPKSRTFDLLHLTELPSWQVPEVFGEIKSAYPGASIWIETTAAGTGNFFHELWEHVTKQVSEGKPPDYTPLFYSFELHDKYQIDLDSRPDLDLTEDQWKEAQEKYGFTSRPHAAWWFRELAEKKKGIATHLHNYPLCPDHAFRQYEGRYIEQDPIVIKGEINEGVEVFHQPERFHRYICSADTSMGVNRDGNALMVFDRTTHQLMAAWKDNKTTFKEVATKMEVINKLFKPDYFVVETNGVGNGTSVEARSRGLPVREFWQTPDTKLAGLQLARDAILDGSLYGPESLKEECGSLRQHPTTGKMIGKKDLLMCAGMALQDIQRNPHVIRLPRDPNRFYPEDWE